MNPSTTIIIIVFLVAGATGMKINTLQILLPISTLPQLFSSEYASQAAQSRDYHQFLTNLATPVFVLATWETGIDLVLNWVQVSRFLTYLIRSKHVLKERVSRPNHENNPKKTRIKK